jgi:DNA-binding MarR family transcriptional regulator
MSNRGVLPFAVTHVVRDTCMCLSVHRAARALARRYDDALRPARLTNGQFSLLMSLNRAEAPSIGSVATLLVMDRTTLTANLKPLVRRKLVKVMIDPTDKRGRRLVLTSAGRVALIHRTAAVEEGAGAERVLDWGIEPRSPARRSRGAVLRHADPSVSRSKQRHAQFRLRRDAARPLLSMFGRRKIGETDAKPGEQGCGPRDI